MNEISEDASRYADPIVLKCCSTAGWGGEASPRALGTLVVTEWPVLNCQKTCSSMSE